MNLIPFGFFLLILVGICSVELNLGQNRISGETIIVWSPPDKSFTIEVPAKLKEDKETYESTMLFGAVKSTYVLKVHIIDNENEKLSSKEKFAGLEFVIGGDDDHEFTETYLKIDNLDAKEIVYKNLNAKGLMIDAGNRIFVLCLASKNRKELDSIVAKRFFTSFHLLK
jgi:hypothetical protein